MSKKKNRLELKSNGKLVESFEQGETDDNEEIDINFSQEDLENINLINKCLDDYCIPIPYKQNYSIHNIRLGLIYINQEYDKEDLKLFLDEKIAGNGSNFIKYYFLISGNLNVKYTVKDKPQNQENIRCTIALFECANRFQTKSKSRLNYKKNIYPLVSHFSSMGDLIDCVKYLVQNMDDTNPVYNIQYSKKNLMALILNAENKETALKYANNFQDVVIIKNLYDNSSSNKNKLLIPIKLKGYSWHKYINDKIKEIVDNKIDMYTFDYDNFRLIDWFFDTRGDCEKTLLAKYYEQNYPNICRRLDLDEKSSNYHVSTTIKGFINKGWNGNVLFVDIPNGMVKKRMKETLYIMLEKLKDGANTTSKYEGEAFLYINFYVFVVTNFPPDVASMTKKRFNIFHIDKRRGRISHLWPEDCIKNNCEKRYKPRKKTDYSFNNLQEDLQLLNAKDDDTDNDEENNYTINEIEEDLNNLPTHTPIHFNNLPGLDYKIDDGINKIVKSFKDIIEKIKISTVDLVVSNNNISDNKTHNDIPKIDEKIIIDDEKKEKILKENSFLSFDDF
jgi:hypothetical protein